MKNKLFYIIMFVIIAGVIGFTGYKAYNEFFKKEKEVEAPKKVQLDSLELYGYTLNDDATEIYKTYFNELKEVLNKETVDEKEYAKEITKLFITDFYTLKTKISSSDFGGLEFIHPKLKENFMLNAGDTIYNHVKTNLDGKREQSLPEVKSVEITEVTDYQYPYLGNYVNGYKVSATWEYVEDLGYENQGNFYLIKEENKLYIVEK